MDALTARTVAQAVYYDAAGDAVLAGPDHYGCYSVTRQGARIVVGDAYDDDQFVGVDWTRYEMVDGAWDEAGAEFASAADVRGQIEPMLRWLD